jgi:SAM-dependent methyltransferase
LERFFLRERYVKRELKKFPTEFWETAHILDAGFGYGQYSYFLKRKFPHTTVTGIEIETIMIDDFQDFISRTGLKKIELEKLDLTEMNYAAKFDLVLSIDVMEHIKEDELSFHNIHRAMKFGALFLLHTPHLKNAKHPGTGVFVEEHFRDGYTTEDIITKLKTAGFDKIEYVYTYGKPGVCAWKLLQKFPLSLINRSQLFFLLLPFYYILVYPLAEFLMQIELKRAHPQGDGILLKAWK